MRLHAAALFAVSGDDDAAKDGGSAGVSVLARGQDVLADQRHQTLQHAQLALRIKAEETLAAISRYLSAAFRSRR